MHALDTFSVTTTIIWLEFLLRKNPLFFLAGLGSAHTISQSAQNAHFVLFHSQLQLFLVSLLFYMSIPDQL